MTDYDFGEHKFLTCQLRSSPLAIIAIFSDTHSEYPPVSFCGICMIMIWSEQLSYRKEDHWLSNLKPRLSMNLIIISLDFIRQFSIA